MRTLFLFIFFCAFQGADAQYLADNSRTVPVDEVFRRGERAYRAGDHAQAIKAYTVVLERDSGYISAYSQRALCHAIRNEHRLAVNDLDQVIQRSPDHIWAYRCRSASYAKMGLHQEAIADLDRVLELDPRNEEAYNDRGWSRKAMGDMVAACQDWSISRDMGNDEARIILTNNSCK